MLQVFFILFFFIFSPTIVSYAKQQKELLLTVSTEYNDNIYLRSKNKESDFITYISPAIKYDNFFKKNYLRIFYTPTWTIYYSHPESNTLRHDITFNFSHYFTRHLNLSINEHYIKSEEPLEKIGKKISQTVRRERNVYERNRVESNLKWQYNKYSYLKLGYIYQFLYNRDPTYDDTNQETFYLKLKRWPDIKHGINLNFFYERNRTSREIGRPELPGFDGYEVNMFYSKRMNQRLELNFGFNLIKRGFLEENIKDRYVRSYFFNVFYRKSPLTDLSFGIFQFRPYGVGLNKYFTGYRFNIKKKISKRTQISFFLKRSWDVGYLEARRRGFTRYTRINSSLIKRISKTTVFNYSFYYRRNHYYHLRPSRDTIYILNLGLQKEITPSLSVALTYRYDEMTSSVRTYNYVSHSISFSFQYYFKKR